MNRFTTGAPVATQHRRGRSLTGVSKDTDENLDLFSRNRRSLSVTSSDEPTDVSIKLGKISVGSVKLSKNGMDDLLSSVEGGKNDYDWLLTPPGTPLFSSSDVSESRPTVAAPRSNSSARSVSTTKASRLSVTQSDSNYSSRPARSSSVTRPSVSSMNYNIYSSNSNRTSNILNTSLSSVTSISRPSTPGGRSALTSTARPSTPTGRSVPSRPSTPVRSRPTPNSSCSEKTRPSQNYPRPSTPTLRPQLLSNMNSMATRPSSRPSTPTRRNSVPNPLPATGRAPSTGRGLVNGRNSAPASRGSSPGPRARPPPQSIVPPDFPLDTPPNLRTTLPDRPVSAGRSRPSAAASVRGNTEAQGPANPPRRQSSSPVVTRGRLPELSGRSRLPANGHSVNVTDNQKTPPSEPGTRRTAKPATATESTGFGRTISKKSLDMALRHMDIRNGSGIIRPMSGSTLFPQSIRSGAPRSQHSRVTDAPVPECSNVVPATISSTTTLENGNCNNRLDGETTENDRRLSAKVSDIDIYESSRYDAILLREDAKNTNWLHSIDDKSDPGLIFDHRFEPLPEPFDPL